MSKKSFKEDAPTNATGPAVVGTGDDNKTWKKKHSKNCDCPDCKCNKHIKSDQKYDNVCKKCKIYTFQNTVMNQPYTWPFLRKMVPLESSVQGLSSFK